MRTRISSAGRRTDERSKPGTGSEADVPGGVWANIGPVLNFLDANATIIGIRSGRSPQFLSERSPRFLSGPCPRHHRDDEDAHLRDAGDEDGDRTGQPSSSKGLTALLRSRLHGQAEERTASGPRRGTGRRAPPRHAAGGSGRRGRWIPARSPRHGCDVQGAGDRHAVSMTADDGRRTAEKRPSPLRGARRRPSFRGGRTPKTPAHGLEKPPWRQTGWASS